MAGRGREVRGRRDRERDREGGGRNGGGEDILVKTIKGREGARTDLSKIRTVVLGF